MATTVTSPIKVIATEMYVAVGSGANNNKFWKYEHLSGLVTEPGKEGKMETGDTRITWGRIGGKAPESMVMMWDEKYIKSKIAEKTSPKKKPTPYKKFEGMGVDIAPISGQSLAKEQVKRLAVAEIAGSCPITATLIKRLAEANRHQLQAATGGKIDIDTTTGIVTTALGVVTSEAIKEARQLLDRMIPYVQRYNTDNAPYQSLLDNYLTLIPQGVGTMKRDWHVSFIKIDDQTTLLDQLETSVDLANQRMADALKNGDVARPAMFECKMTVVEDKDVWTKVKNLYYDSRNHSHSCSHLKPVRVWEVAIPHMVTAFDAQGRKVGNVKLLWHGTRVFNVLSILKRGFVLPTQLSTAQTNGAMYGNGLYFSDQSTKSLNYAYGYWDGGGRDSNCYMFLNDVAMGKMYLPSRSGNGNKPGYDSCFARAGQSGVYNNEMIVYKASQVNPRYLVEFNS